MLRKLKQWSRRNRKSSRATQGTRANSRRNNLTGATQLGIESLETRWMLAAGDLDPTFDVDGIVIDDLGLGKSHQIHAVAVQNDGKILVAGLAANSITSTTQHDAFIARYNADGTRDLSFGAGATDWYTLFDFAGAVEEDNFRDIAIDSTGRIIAVGTAHNAATNTLGFLVARFTSAGVLDTTFGGGDGFDITPVNFPLLPADARAEGVALQSDGSIVAGGFVVNGVSDDFVVVRYTSAGTEDATFNGDGNSDGIIVTAVGTLRDQCFDVAIQSDGRIVAVGSTEQLLTSFDFGVVRYNTDGSLDTTFDGDGKAITDLTHTELTARDDRALAVALDGTKIVVAGFSRLGSTNRQTALARYDSTGSLDTTFNPGSVNTTTTAATLDGTARIRFPGQAFSSGQSLAIQPDGKYVVGAQVSTSSGVARDFGVIRLLNDGAGPAVDGTLDLAFNTDGLVVTPFAPNASELNAVVMQPDGRIVTAGWTTVSGVQKIAILRYESGLLAADAGGPYTINEPGGSVLLSGSGGGLGATYAWDLDGDAIFGETGAAAANGDENLQNPTFTVSGVDGPNDVFTVTLQLTEGLVTVFDTATVQIVNVAPTLTLSGAAAVNEGAVYTLNLSSFDPGPDTISSWTINWGDSTEVISGNPLSVTHIYADGNANYTISATATDEDGTYAAGNTVAVTVNNVAPSLVISGAASVNEGAVYTLNLSATDPGTDTITQWTIDWGDAIEVVSGNPSSVTHTYADGTANYNISATATDEDGTFASNTIALTVNNVAPILTISGAADVDEDAVYTLNLSSSDQGTDTITQWTIDWGDAIEVVSGNPSNVTHIYADGDANYTISATATDEDGTFAAAATVAVMVHNIAPSLAISGAATTNEGSTYTLNLSSSDPGDDTITQWTIDWGDMIEVVSGNPASVNHIYADGDANYTITATASDEDGTFAAGNSVAVMVNNVAPTLSISGAANVNEGSVYTLNLSSLDPGDDTITQWTIDWGDGIEIVSGDPSSVTHTYADGTANYTISATATDEDGTFAAGNTVSVQVDNVAPNLSISGAGSVDEGSVYTLNLSSSDPGADTITSWTINWGDSIEVVTGNPASVTHTYADGGNPNTPYAISASATDEDGTFAAGNTVAVVVNNVAPTASAGGPYFTFEDTPITLNGSAFDPAGAADSLTFLWDLDGDSVFGETGAGATRGDEVGANPTFDPDGLGTVNWTVSLQVNDEDGGVSSIATASVQVLGQGSVVVGGVLHIVGSNNCDIVIITKVGSNIKVIATFNPSNPMFFDESSITEINVRVRGASDIVVTTPNVTKPMTIDGGSGNDLLMGGGGANLILGDTGSDALMGGGSDDVLLGGEGNDDMFGHGGNDVLVGGDGNDMLFGGAGRDLLIGSQDEDYLNAGTDEDILIGGYTSHDNNLAALDAVMAVWTSADSFDDRVADLTGSGGLLEAGVTVFDDDDDDTLIGGAGRDLIFGDTTPWDGSMDTISLQPLLDVLVAVN
jgi:uncharacterized delta-60 repeat protein